MPPQTTRRKFVINTTLGGVGMSLAPQLWLTSAAEINVKEPKVLHASGERICTSPGSYYRAYRSKTAAKADSSSWLQIDLGASFDIDSVKLYPMFKTYTAPGDGFPLRFRIECSDDPQFAKGISIFDGSRANFPDPADCILEFGASRCRGRYVRFTATRLGRRKPPPFLGFVSEAFRKQYLATVKEEHFFALSKVEVLGQGVDLAQQRPVQVDPVLGLSQDAAQLTRARRPQGEGVITDNPQNVTSPRDWHRVSYSVDAPRSGVQVRDGLFLTAMNNNVRYLLESFSTDELLRQFRQRAGLPVPEPRRPPHWAWDELLAGSNAGRFLMGSGNTLRWLEHPELRNRMNTVVDGIADCRQSNGYIMAYPEKTFLVFERAAFARAWLTHGLLQAHEAGNPKALELLRGYYDWYNQCSFLPEALRGCPLGAQGMVANTRVYFSSLGKPADLQVLQRYFQENYWLEDLSARRPEALWQYPYDRPHVYELTFLEAYLDLYRATGDERYLRAVLGGWELIRTHWQFTGGNFALVEFEGCPPDTYPLYENRGETCGSAFWILLNHRLHQLEPQNEQYVAEIEKSIYNVILANQAGSTGIRYFTHLVGQKEHPKCESCCCEGQGTRILGSLPEYIYSIARNGLYVNLFESSTLATSQSGVDMVLDMSTRFPLSPQVKITIRATRPIRTSIHVRTPAWAARAMKITVNGAPFTTGTPGTYVRLDREWSNADVIEFELPMQLKLTRYPGVDQIAGRERFALEYGPILMALLGTADAKLEVSDTTSVDEVASRLQQVRGEELHFTLGGEAAAEARFVPYFAIAEEPFSCFPIIEVKS